MTKNITTLYFTLLLCSLPSLSSASSLQCIEIFKKQSLFDFTYPDSYTQSVFGKISDQSHPIAFEGTFFRHGGFLRSLIELDHSSLQTWLNWLKSDTPGYQHNGLSLVYSNQQLIKIVRPMSYPFDHLNPSRQGPTPHETAAETSARHFYEIRGPSEKAQNQAEELLTLQLFGALSPQHLLRGDANVPPTVHGMNIHSQASNPSLLASLPVNRYNYKVVDEFMPGDKRPKNEDVLKDFEAVAKIIYESESYVTVKISLKDPKKLKNENQTLIQKMFFITYWQLVQRSYRNKGRLFPDTLDSAIYLLESFLNEVVHMKEGEKDLYLHYPTAIWASLRFRMQFAHRYISIYDSSLGGWGPLEYVTIPNGFSPLFPVYGIATERHLPTGALEVKRFFNNKEYDPLQVFPSHKLEPANAAQFLNTIARQIPAGSNLIAFSKSKVHNRMYTGMGFTQTNETHNPEWNSPMYTLEQSLTNFIKTTTQE